MLAYMLQLSPDVDRLRQLVRKRLMEPARLDLGERQLHGMLLSLHAAGVVRLEPEPPQISATSEPAPAAEEPAAPKLTPMARLIVEALAAERKARGEEPLPQVRGLETQPEKVEYRPERAHPTARMNEFFLFRSVNPLYALFLLDQFPLADENEFQQALESVLELPRSLLRHVRVPPPDRLPPGPLAREKVDVELVARGLIAAGDLYPQFDPDIPFEERKYAPPLADKLRMLFDSEFPQVHGVTVTPAWVTPNILLFGGDFQKYIAGHDLAKQEGLIFRHLLRLILLLGEFSQVTPPGLDGEEWRTRLRTLADRLTAACRAVDPQSTEYALTHAADRDVVPHEPATTTAPPPSAEIAEEASEEALAEEDFGSGIAGAE
jgi:hypothetical protein